MVELPDAFVPPPENIAELADACVRFVERATSLTLDYTPETLPFLDHWVREMKEKPAHEILSLVGPTAGAYFGEVVRRAHPNVRWRAEGDDFQRFRLEYENCFLHFNPIGVAVEAITMREAAGWSSHFQMLDEDADAVAASLQNSGPVREDDYFRFAVRFETVDQVFAVLSSLALSRGEGARRFGPEVYAAIDDDRPPPGGMTH